MSTAEQTTVESRLSHRPSMIDTIEVAHLEIDHTVQHPLREGKVRHMLKQGYDPALSGIITVSQRMANGQARYFVVDGQHRVEAARRSGFPYIDAKIWGELSYAEENWLFAYLNDKSNPTQVYLFRAKVHNEEHDAYQINSIITNLGWHLSNGKNGTGAFAAISAAQRIYNGIGLFRSHIDGDILFRRTMETVTDAWGLRKTASDGQILEGVAVFLSRHWDEADQGRLVKALAKLTPEAFRAEGEAVKKSLSIRPALAYGWTVHREYNKGTRTKLPVFAL